jgi:predicted metal-dependent HD superfamily phosphohydrolase
MDISDLNKKKNDQIAKFFKGLTKLAIEIDPNKVIPLEQTEIIIRSMYEQEHRYYHNIKHINFCLNKLKEYRKATKSGESNCEALLKFAILTHDIIYIPGNDGDEIHSGFVAKALIMQLGTRLFSDMAPQDIANELESLIYITSHVIAPTHQHRQHCNEAIIADVDLAILGADPKTFKQYEKNIRKEYGSTRDSYFNKGRFKFLQQISNKSNIFWTEYFKDTYEQQARINIKESMAILQPKVYL